MTLDELAKVYERGPSLLIRMREVHALVNVLQVVAVNDEWLGNGFDGWRSATAITKAVGLKKEHVEAVLTMAGALGYVEGQESPDLFMSKRYAQYRAKDAVAS